VTDPFGNYLCQKLVEYCGDDQRMMIVEKVAPDIVTISLNMHGTRAIQKMIEFLNLPQQVSTSSQLLLILLQVRATNLKPCRQEPLLTL
jgi:hypothetical protein